TATVGVPSGASRSITLKAEEADAVVVGQVVCLIATSTAKPEAGAAPTAEAPKVEEKKEEVEPASAPVNTASTYATGAASPAAKKILEEKNIDPATIQGTGKDGRVTKEDTVKAVHSMGTPTGGPQGTERKKMSMLRRKVAERLV